MEATLASRSLYEASEVLGWHVESPDPCFLGQNAPYPPVAVWLVLFVGIEPLVVEESWN